ncbi:MAG: iron-sulfur cluster assembly scaffold protein [Candidatus Odinarchaeota archaeon]
MPNNFDKFVENLQNEIMQKEIKDHNKKIIELYINAKNWGKPPKQEITVFEELEDKIRGYFLGLYLQIENDLITKANFITDGCGVMVAIGSQLTIIITGKSVKFAEDFKPNYLIEAFNGIPTTENYNIELAIKTLKNALKKYKKNVKYEENGNREH